MKRLFFAIIAAAIVNGFAPPALNAQGGRGGRAAAPVDLTGYWVAVVSEDWRHRMATPKKGDFESIPLSAEGTRVANTWDLAKDDAAGLQCKAFGVGGIIRQPTRLHIAWQDANRGTNATAANLMPGARRGCCTSIETTRPEPGRHGRDIPSRSGRPRQAPVVARHRCARSWGTAPGRLRRGEEAEASVADLLLPRP